MYEIPFYFKNNKVKNSKIDYAIYCINFFKKNITNIIYFTKKFLTEIKNIIDIGEILISRFYFVLLFYNSDTMSKFENYITAYIRFKLY